MPITLTPTLEKWITSGSLPVTWASGASGLTDAELRASPVPVTIAGATVTLNVDEITGVDVTDRAARQVGHVTVDASALPTGAATEATLATRATEATLATRATEATLATRASDAGLASVFARQADGTQKTQVTSLPAGLALASTQTDGTQKTQVTNLVTVDDGNIGTFSYVATVLTIGGLSVLGRVVAMRFFAANGTDATFNINGGDTVTVRSGVGFDEAPSSKLISPTFNWLSGTIDVFVELA